MAQVIGMVAVGVQLDGIAHLPHPADEIPQFGMQQRLAAGDAHPVQCAPPPAQQGEHLFLQHGMRRRGAAVQQGSVMAEGAAKIAPLGKHGAGGMLGIIQQRQLLQPGKQHGTPSLHRLNVIIAAPKRKWNGLSGQFSERAKRKNKTSCRPLSGDGGLCYNHPAARRKNTETEMNDEQQRNQRDPPPPDAGQREYDLHPRLLCDRKKGNRLPVPTPFGINNT